MLGSKELGNTELNNTGMDKLAERFTCVCKNDVINYEKFCMCFLINTHACSSPLFKYLNMNHESHSLNFLEHQFGFGPYHSTTTTLMDLRINGIPTWTVAFIT